jgi:hypothetical protein
MRLVFMLYLSNLVLTKERWNAYMTNLLMGTFSALLFDTKVITFPFSYIFVHFMIDVGANISEFVSVSTFVLSGAQLVAKVHLEGPFATADSIKSGQDLQEKIEKIGSNNEFKIFSETVDFEHLNLGPDDEDDDKSNEELNKKGLENETTEEKRARRALERKKMLEARQRQETRKHHQKRKIRNEGDPYTRTIKAHGEGWYRFCVTATVPITVEMDLRKSSDMGGLDSETGHVLTLAQKLLNEEDENMRLDSASEEGIDDKDFESTKEKLKTLRRLLADIQTKQEQERHRLIVHAATNEHSHSHMVLGSLLETVLFMLVTGYQVYTIRRWFSGAPVLGR